MKRYVELVNNELVVPSVELLRRAEWKSPLKMVKKIIRHFHEDSLYRNSIYLMLSTFIMAFFGFFFWIIVTRLYSSEEIGVATTLISITTLLGNFSTIGLNIGLIRFLPSSKEKIELINIGFVVGLTASIIISFLFLLGLQFFTPSLIFLYSRRFYIFTFIVFICAFTLNSLVESIFISYRSTGYTLFKNLSLSITKIFLPIILLIFGAYGIYMSVGIAQLISLVIAIAILFKYFNYQLNYVFNVSLLKRMFLYSFNTYIATFVGSLPALIMPIIITNNVGSSLTVYFFIPMIIANLIYIIPHALTQSLFSEGVNDPKSLINNIIKTALIVLVAYTAVLVIVVFFGKIILSVYGKDYSEKGYYMLILLSNNSFLVGINNIIITILLIRKKVIYIVVANLISLLSCVLISSLIKDNSLFGYGLALVMGNFLSTIYLVVIMWKRVRFLIIQTLELKLGRNRLLDNF